MVVEDGLSGLWAVVLENVNIIHSEDISVAESYFLGDFCEMREGVCGDFEEIFVVLVWYYDEVTRTCGEVVKKCCDEVVLVDGPARRFSGYDRTEYAHGLVSVNLY